MSKRPNILYLHSHDTGRHIEPMGAPVATPNLMKLSQQGMMMRRCFCANPTCSPSRASLFTGQYPHTNGMIGLENLGYCIAEPHRAIPNYLREQAGYRTVLAGTQHVIPYDRASEIGFEEVLERVMDPNASEDDPTNDSFATVARGAANWWEQVEKDRPIFLSMGLSKPQWYNGKSKDVDRVGPLPGLPDTPLMREHAARLHAGVEAIDRAFGMMLDALERTGLADNTLVICTTDHGLAIPHHKCNLTDGGLGVLSIWRGPGGFTGGKITDALVSHVDFFPTLCDVAGVAHPEGLQGVSLLTLAQDPQTKVRDHIFGEVNYHAAYEPMRCVRDERYKYIRRYDHRNRRVLPNCDPSPSKEMLLAHGWAHEPIQEELLYDTLFDAHERVNLLDDLGRPKRPEHAEVLEKLRNRLNRWMDETEDPIRNGFIMPHPGTQTVDPNSIHNKGVKWALASDGT